MTLEEKYEMLVSRMRELVTRRDQPCYDDDGYERGLASACDEAEDILLLVGEKA